MCFSKNLRCGICLIVIANRIPKINALSAETIGSKGKSNQTLLWEEKSWISVKALFDVMNDNNPMLTKYPIKIVKAFESITKQIVPKINREAEFEKQNIDEEM